MLVPSAALGSPYRGQRLACVGPRQVVDQYKVPNRLKILIGMYMIATKVEHVYEVVLPAEVRGCCCSCA